MARELSKPSAKGRKQAELQHDSAGVETPGRSQSGFSFSPFLFCRLQSGRRQCRTEDCAFLEGTVIQFTRFFVVWKLNIARTTRS